jgi:hypothetical protein
MKPALRRDTSQRVSGLSPFQKPVSWIGKPPMLMVSENASRSISCSQSRSRRAIHWRSSALA